MEIRQISKSKKGMAIGDAPMVILIVGIVFLMMVMVGYISEKYGDSLGTTAVTVYNETLTTVDNSTGEYVASSSHCNFQDFSVSAVYNASNGYVVPSTNYTTTTSGAVVAVGFLQGVTDENWNVSYSYAYSGIACNITEDLETELSDNSSMAGMLLTISFIGIILGVLISVFALGGKRRM